MENLHDWINSAVLIILVFIIAAQNGILKNMKSFMDIFDIKKVREYSDMREETIKIKSIALLNDNKEVQSMINKATNNQIENVKEIYFKQMNGEHDELIDFSITVLLEHKKHDRDKIINHYLPQTSRYMIEICDDIENNESLQNHKNPD